MKIALVNFRLKFGATHQVCKVSAVCACALLSPRECLLVSVFWGEKRIVLFAVYCLTLLGLL